MGSSAYRAWVGLGNAIGKHMVVVVPICLVLGIFAPGAFSPLLPAVPFLFAIMSFQSSLNIRVESLKEAVLHPVAIISTLVFVHIAMPVITYLLGTLMFGAYPDIVTGIVLEYSVPLATSTIMWVNIYRGNSSVALCTLFASVLLSPFLTPLTLQLFFGAVVEIDTAGMLTDMIFMVALPAIAALIFNESSKGWAERKASPALAPLARIAMILIITSNTTAISNYVMHLTPLLLGVLVFIGCMVFLGFCMGILLAKVLKQPRDKSVVMTFQCGMRNISSGAVLAVQYFAPATVFPVMAGVLFQQLSGALFGHIVSKVFPENSPSQEPKDR